MIKNFFADMSQQMNGHTYPIDDQMLNYTLYQPTGEHKCICAECDTQGYQYRCYFPRNDSLLVRRPGPFVADHLTRTDFIISTTTAVSMRI